MNALKLKHAALIAAMALIPAFALAQGTPAPAAGSSVTSPASTQSAKHAEREQRRAAKFAAADKNGDGSLTKAEVDAAGMKHISKHFDAIDANHDGKITREELAAYRKAHKGRHHHHGAGTSAPAAPAPATPAPAAPAK